MRNSIVGVRSNYQRRVRFRGSSGRNYGFSEGCVGAKAGAHMMFVPVMAMIMFMIMVVPKAVLITMRSSRTGAGACAEKHE